MLTASDFEQGGSDGQSTSKPTPHTDRLSLIIFFAATTVVLPFIPFASVVAALGDTYAAPTSTAPDALPVDPQPPVASASSTSTVPPATAVEESSAVAVEESSAAAVEQPPAAQTADTEYHPPLPSAEERWYAVTVGKEVGVFQGT